MGFPYGADEDAAYMTTWLELYKLGGIQKFAQLSKKLDNNFNGKFNLSDIKLEKSINLFHTSLLMKGPGLFDFLYEETKKNKYLEVKLENCIDPVCVIPLAKRLSDNLDFVSGCWIDENERKIGLNISKSEIFIGELKNNIKIYNGQVILQFSTNYKKYYKKKYLLIKKINIQINDASKQQHLEKSINPNSTDWKIISKYAQRTFVSASDESRKKGAGGGDDND
jgi:hypothetical protein